MKSKTSPALNITRIDFLSFLIILVYFLTLVLFSYEEGETLYAKIAAVVLVMYFLMKQVVGKGNRLEFPAEYRILIGWFTWSIFSFLTAINQDIAFNKAITLFQVLFCIRI